MASRYWVGGGSSTSFNAVSPTNWAATSGGANNQSVPTTADDVFFDAGSSATSNWTTLVSINTLDMLGYTGAITQSNGAGFNIAGNLCRFPVGGSIAWAGGIRLTFTSTSGVILFYSNGKQLGCGITINGVGGTLQLQDALNLMASNTTDLTLTNGTFDANGFNVTIGQLLSSGATARTLLMGSGLWTIGPFNNISAVNINPPSLTFNAGTANINWFGGGPTTNVWQVNTPLSFNDLTIYGSALPGNHFARFTGAAHTFNNMRFDTSLGPLIVDFGTSTATRHTLAGLSVNASNAVPVQFFNSLWLYPAGPIIASGTITVDHAVMFNITASGGATFNATNTLDVGNNTGWASITPPSGGGSGAPGHANMSGGLNG